MWGRARRASRRLAGGDLRVAGIVHAYDPTVFGSALALGMGAAAASAGGATARDASGRLVSATSLAVNRMTSWAVEERQAYTSLPHSILAVVTDSSVLLCRWSPVARPGPPTTWPAGSSTATYVRHRFGGAELQVVLQDQKLAVLSALSGPHHRAGRRTLRAIAALASG